MQSVFIPNDEDEGTIDRPDHFYINEHISCPEGAPVCRGPISLDIPVYCRAAGYTAARFDAKNRDFAFSS